MQWQADTIQAVVFTAPFGSAREASAVWADLFPGDTPDGYQRNPASPNLQSSASGERLGYAVSVSTQVGHIAINLNQVFRQLPGLISSPSGPPRIEDVPAATQLLVDLAKRISLESDPVRIAVVIDLGATINGELKASLFQDSLPGVPFPEGATDPSFSFNAPTRFARAAWLVMNRVCTWSTGQFGFVAGNAQGMQAGLPMTMSNYIGCKVDVNTAPGQIVPRALSQPIFDELRDEALAIVRDQLRRFA
ncbi:hypothetical protein HMP09_0194 [Sphingomonas sp. HMP9]|uniref:hypothetical protein n=1 Tax=Sphingomonas sp. HMP9 TaxID=1517554 RepID=UPI0015966909|nr:hypothetical protein [Sphingomonas sp. HMP9]BCA60960.1 hypothetical protein HMP09_0194 [Sphingomonas sp. HMP9]